MAARDDAIEAERTATIQGEEARRQEGIAVREKQRAEQQLRVSTAVGLAAQSQALQRKLPVEGLRLAPGDPLDMYLEPRAGGRQVDPQAAQVCIDEEDLFLGHERSKKGRPRAPPGQRFRVIDAKSPDCPPFWSTRPEPSSTVRRLVRANAPRRG